MVRLGVAAIATFATMGAVADTISSAELASVRDITSLTLSSDRKIMAFRVSSPDPARNTVSLLWFSLDLQSGNVTKLGDGGLPVFGSQDAGSGPDPASEVPIWDKRGDSIYYRALTATGMQVWRATTSGKAAALVLDTADVKKFVLSGDGHFILYSVGADRSKMDEAERQIDLYGRVIEDPMELGGSLVRQAPINGIWRTLQIRNGVPSTLPLGVEDRVKAFDLQSKRIVLASDAQREEFERRTAPPDNKVLGIRTGDSETIGSRVAYAQVETHPKGRLSALSTVGVYDTASPQSRILCPKTDCTGRIAGLTWDRSGENVYFTADTVDEPATTLYVWNVATNNVRIIWRSRGTMYRRFRGVPDGCHIVEREAICAAEDVANPPRIISISLDSGEQKTLYDPNVELRAKTLGGEVLRWTHPSGLQFSGTLILPPLSFGRSKLPLVIAGYRCRGFLRGGTGEDVPEQVLAYSGFAVLCANANHDAIAQTGQNGRPLYFAGHRAAAESYDGFVSVLSERGLVDRTKVGVSGFSYGAGILGWALIHSKSYAAAALSTVPYNPFLYYMQYRPETFFGLPRLDRDPENRWGEVAMALSPERVRVPILAQTNVNTAKAMADMANVFSRDKKPLEIIVYTDEGHHKWQPLHRRLVYERYVDWFRYWLQGHVSPDSTKRTQYIRWERLRAMQERTYNEN